MRDRWNTRRLGPFRWKQFPGTGPNPPQRFFGSLRTFFVALLSKAARYQQRD